LVQKRVKKVNKSTVKLQWFFNMEADVKSVKEVKKVQVDGKKHLVLAEDAEIEKLLQRGLSLKGKIKDLEDELDVIQDRIIEIARDRREETTTVTLDSITARPTQ
jgi:cell division protein FtsB